jgi:hypothetical protein
MQSSISTARAALRKRVESVSERANRVTVQDVSVLDVLRTLPERADDRAFWMTAGEALLSLYYDRLPETGLDFAAQDWDTMIILDACRYDLFEEKRPESWPTSLRVRSRASHTTGFYKANFTDGPYLDTVLVTANPKAVQERGDAFHDVIKVYETDWDDEKGTVMPDAMARATIEAHENYPDKRVVSHWIQPHYPFVGGDGGGYDFLGEAIWYDLMRGTVDPETVYADYAATLEMAIPYVQEVLDAIEGRTVVTSDHGNLFGEHPWFYPAPIYGHPRGIKHPDLVDVPWSVIDQGPRREVTEGESRVADAGSDDEVKARLESLGYV